MFAEMKSRMKKLNVLKRENEARAVDRIIT